jgi:hypothetical protein
MVKSRTDKDLPIFEKLHTAMDEPTRNNDRNDMELPTTVQSNTDIAAPKRE